jgi:hypothetical protein
LTDGVTKHEKKNGFSAKFKATFKIVVA